jgi:polyisoprenoid-binding protein YceI
MKLFNSIITFSALVISTSLMAKTYQLDTKSSKLTWTGSKVLVPSKHTGTVDIKSGQVEFGKDGPTSAVVVVDMKTIKNEDLTDAAYNKKLVGHLRSPDFFDVEKHPEAKLKVTSFKKQGPASYDLTGDLTIKGTTKPVTFKATTASEKGGLSKISADLEFDRTDFDVRYGSGKFFQNLGDKVISDKVQLKVELTGKLPLQVGAK